MMQQLEGRAWKYGDNINTDIISPPAFMECTIEEAARHAMAPVDARFGAEAAPGDFFVAQRNLGSGSSRETAPLTLKALGIQAVIAMSYARIFYRNAFNIGLLALECPRCNRVQQDDCLRVDLRAGAIVNLTQNETYPITPMPPHMIQLVEAGGLIPYLEQFRLYDTTLQSH